MATTAGLLRLEPRLCNRRRACGVAIVRLRSSRPTIALCHCAPTCRSSKTQRISASCKKSSRLPGPGIDRRGFVHNVQ